MGADRSFPLDAEQIVRLAGAVLTRVLNASRPADSRAVGEEGLILALGEAVGVPLLVERNQFGILELQPYGRKASASQTDGEA
ncbi:MAG: hypothetical protein K2X54_02120 [Methylobacterium organophilum]|nr:hypothetical protein [Methylobacterium organophilum]